jgi:hypothetical protein
VVVSYETVSRWCDKSGREFARRVKEARPAPGTNWHLDEIFVKIDHEPYLLWRAFDQHGAEHRPKSIYRRVSPNNQRYPSFRDVRLTLPFNVPSARQNTRIGVFFGDSGTELLNS